MTVQSQTAEENYIMLHPMHTWSARNLGGASALLSACMVLAALPVALVTGYGDLVTNLLFDAPLLILSTILTMNRLLQQVPASFRRSVLIVGLTGWTVLWLDTLVYDLIPLFGLATDVWANTRLMALVPLRNGLIFVGFGGWMLGSGVLWRMTNARLPKAIGWLHIAAGSPWVGLGIISWSMSGSTGNISELPLLVMTIAQVLFPLVVVGYFGWTLLFGRWLQQHSHLVV
jgi:hypothetical protein